MSSSAPRTAGVIVALAACVLAAGYFGNTLHEKAEGRTKAMALTGGDPDAGKLAIGKYGCGGCHTIPGAVAARGLSGPPLTGFGERVWIAGELRNTPKNLVTWIKDPHAVEPHTAMPNMGVSDRDARDIAAYLYTLE